MSIVKEEHSSAIESILVKNNGFEETTSINLLTSGEAAFYYIHTENIVQDNGKFRDFKFR